jgi:N4-gp56 family major capsid protein
MAIEAFDKMAKELETLKLELAETKSASEKQLEELHKELGVLSERKTSFDDTVVSDKEIAKAKEIGANLHLKSILTGRPASSFAEYKEVAGLVEKALVPADISSWLAEEFSGQMLTMLEAELMIEPLFSKLQMPANRNQFSIPGRTTDATAYLIAPGADAIESTIAAGKVTFATNRIKTLVSVTDQADQDAVVAVMDLVKQELSQSLARASEQGIIAGDTSFTNANDVRKAFDGLLKMAVSAGMTVDGGAAKITAAVVLAARKKLGVYGLNLTDLAIIAPVNVAYDMLAIPEVMTVDKYGQAATILTGEIGKLYGMPIVASAYIPSNLTALGVVDTTTPGTKTAVLVVNKRFFGIADRGAVGLEEERKAVSSSTLYVGYRDLDFKKLSVVATPVVAVVNL